MAVDVSVGDTHMGIVVVDVAKATMTTRKELPLNAHSVLIIVELNVPPSKIKIHLK